MPDRLRCLHCGRELKVVGRIKNAAGGDVTMIQPCTCGISREDDVSHAAWEAILRRLGMP